MRFGLVAWHIAQIRSAPTAERELRRQGFEMFWPKVVERVSIRNNLIERTRSYFPGYVFLSFDIEDRWQPINWTPGVKGLMMIDSSEQPATISDDVITALRGKCREAIDADGFQQWYVDVKEADKYLFKVGQRLKIVDGAFSGLYGTVSVAERDRVSVLLSIFGRQAPLTVPYANWDTMLEPVR